MLIQTHVYTYKELKEFEIFLNTFTFAIKPITRISKQHFYISFFTVFHILCTITLLSPHFF